MSPQERAWWSSPYLRMLASPVRRCIVHRPISPHGLHGPTGADAGAICADAEAAQGPTVRHLPGRPAASPKSRRVKAGRGIYLNCSREWLALLLKRGKYKRFGAAPTRLGEQIAHLLRLRVLQELQLIAKQLEALYNTRTGPAPARTPLLRRLTRAEWGEFRTSGIIPHPGALAVLVVPPVNRDPTTKQRPSAAGAMSAAPPVDASQPHPPPAPKRELPPLCVLHPTRAPPTRAPPVVTPISQIELPMAVYWKDRLRERAAAVPGSFFIPDQDHPFASTAVEEDEVDEAHTTPHAAERVPLYNGVTLFPGRVQRARLYGLLTRILGVEGAWRFSANSRSAGHKESGKGKGRGDSKGSHAFLACPSHEVDVAALGIALWRVRMWEGGGLRTRSAHTSQVEEREEDDWEEPWVEEIRHSQ
ncbi:hypothetical protein B0H11DRAFT_130366 [Mycena galericulata]|nr:hypothetical protein B0H11DRAFT_130366 [Mycena galericulata]